MHPDRTIVSSDGFRCAIGASYAPLSHTNIRSPSVVRLGAARNPPDRPNEHPRADGGRTRAACAAPTPPQSAPTPPQSAPTPPQSAPTPPQSAPTPPQSAPTPAAPRPPPPTSGRPRRL